jgi:hypothetical protein
MTDPCQRVAAWCFIGAAVLTLAGVALTPQPPTNSIPHVSQTTPASFAAKPPVRTAEVAEVVSVVVTPTPRPQPVVVSPDLSGTHEDWLRAAGIAESDWTCATAIIIRESGWNVSARNPSSGAGGIPQALPATKMASAGSDWATNPVTQLRWMAMYVAARYGGFCPAWSFWQAHHYY